MPVLPVLGILAFIDEAMTKATGPIFLSGIGDGAEFEGRDELVRRVEEAHRTSALRADTRGRAAARFDEGFALTVPGVRAAPNVTHINKCPHFSEGKSNKGTTFHMSNSDNGQGLQNALVILGSAMAFNRHYTDFREERDAQRVQVETFYREGMMERLSLGKAWLETQLDSLTSGASFEGISAEESRVATTQLLATLQEERDLVTAFHKDYGEEVAAQVIALLDRIIGALNKRDCSAPPVAFHQRFDVPSLPRSSRRQGGTIVARITRGDYRTR